MFHRLKLDVGGEFGLTTKIFNQIKNVAFLEYRKNNQLK